MRPTNDTADVDVTRDDVGSEGGSPGDVEVARDPAPATGTEAGETWRPTKHDVDTIVRDETGEGRRRP
jgi:hypothetical protein